MDVAGRRVALGEEKGLFPILIDGDVDDEDGVRYAVAVMANNYTGGVLSMRQAIEYLLVDVFE